MTTPDADLLREIDVTLQQAQGLPDRRTLYDLLTRCRAALTERIPREDALDAALSCVADGASLRMDVGLDALRFAAEAHPDFWDGISGASVPNIKITDAVVFAKEVARAINIENADDGSTLLTRMLDAAINAAVSDGCEGVDHATMPSPEDICRG